MKKISPVVHPRAPIRIYSFVGGGPSLRLCRALRERGHDAREISLFTLPQWRQLSSHGTALRVAAKLSGHTFFPLLATLDALKSPHGVLLATSNPFFLPGLMSISQRWQGKPVAVWLYDWLPMVLEASFPGAGRRPLSALIRRVAAWPLRRADAVVFIGQAMARMVAAQIPLRRSMVLETGAWSAEFCGDISWSPKPADPLWVTYVGNLGRMHDAQTMAAAISAWPEHEAARFVFSLSGRHAAGLRARLQKRSDTDFVAALDDPDWVDLLNKTHVALISLRQEAWQAPIPSKTFSAMAAACALLAVAPARSELARLVKDGGCGLVVEPGDVEGFGTALKTLVSDSRKRRACQAASLTWLHAHYDMRVIAQGWGELCDDLLAEQRAQ